MKVTGSTIEQLDKGVPRNRCRRWRIWASTDHGRKSRRFKGTWTQAREEQKRFVAELEAMVPNAETFAAYAASWLAWRTESGRVSPSTADIDASAVRQLCRTELAGMRMDSITPDDCRAALLWLRDHPMRGDRLSGSTLSRRHTTLALIFSQAHEDGRIASSPMASVKPPKSDTGEREALSPAALCALVDELCEMPPDGRTMSVLLMASAALRRGESCALLDSDVSGGLARIHGTVDPRTTSIGPTKTPAGVRAVPVPERVLAKVGEWRDVRDVMGWSGSPTLCCNTRGGILSPVALSRWWLDNRDSLGCHGMVMHQLRHSNLSMMARHMSPFDLQRYAGWASIQPARIYVHDDLDSVARAVSDAWGVTERTKSAPGGFPAS